MPHPLDELLSRKEIAAYFGRDRITVYRWEQDGLRFVGGRATVSKVSWFLELRDAAREVGYDCQRLVAATREEQERVLRLALDLRRRQA